MSLDRKSDIREIIKQIGIYRNYKRALSLCIQVVEAPPMEQALIMSMWLFGTWDGTYILAHSLLQGLDSVRLPPECLSASRHRISYENFRSASEKKTRGWEQILPSLPMSSGDEGFFMITSTLGTLLSGKSNMGIRMTTSYFREAGIVCPWGASTHGHLMIRIKKLDIRAKQALASLIAGNHFTDAKESLVTRIPIAEGFRWNGVVQETMDRWRPLIVTAFMRVCLDTADEMDGRPSAVAAMNRSVAHLIRVFPHMEYLITLCWELALQPEGKTERILEMLEKSLEADIGYK